LWYPTGNPESIDWCGSQGINTAFSLHFAPSFEHIGGMVDRYIDALETHRGDPGRWNAHVAHPLVGLSAHVHVADTDERAVAQASAAYKRFHHNFMPLRMSPEDAKRYDEPLSWERLYGSGRFFAGSPDTVRKQLRDCLEQTHNNYFLCSFT